MPEVSAKVSDKVKSQIEKAKKMKDAARAKADRSRPLATPQRKTRLGDCIIPL